MSAIATQKRSFDEPSGAPIISKRSKIVQVKNEVDPETQLSKCFHKFTTKLYVSLAPMFMMNPISGIKQQHLDPLLMTFSAEAKGVLLSYSNIKFLQSNYDSDGTALLGLVKYDTPYSFFWISVDFLVWRPLVGDVIEGYSYMQTPSHIGLLIHDTFNANIKKYNLPSSWEFIPNADDENDGDESSNQDEQGDENSNGNKANFRSLGYWVDEEGIKVDGQLKFTIKAIHTAGKLVSVEGTLVKPGEEQQGNNGSNYNSSGFNIKSDNYGSDNIESKSQGKHKKFFDEEEDGFNNVSLTAIPEPVKEGLEEVPKYEKNDDAEDDVIAQEDSSEEEDDDD